MNLREQILKMWSVKETNFYLASVTGEERQISIIVSRFSVNFAIQTIFI